MATKQRKTPCKSVKVQLVLPPTVWMHCNCCGPWEVINGKIVRASA